MHRFIQQYSIRHNLLESYSVKEDPLVLPIAVAELLKLHVLYQTVCQPDLCSWLRQWKLEMTLRWLG